MKTNLKLNSNTPLQALASKARRAVAIAMAERVERPKNNSNKRAVRQIPKIDRDIRSIFKTLTSRVAEDSTVVLEKPAQGASCTGIIRIYRHDDLVRQEHEASCHELRRNTTEGGRRSRPYRAAPCVTYAFYPNVTDITKLGSIAIYGESAESRLRMIHNSGTFFGHEVVSARIEMGMRPFVDVKLRC